MEAVQGNQVPTKADEQYLPWAFSSRKGRPSYGSNQGKGFILPKAFELLFGHLMHQLQNVRAASFRIHTRHAVTRCIYARFSAFETDSDVSV